MDDGNNELIDDEIDDIGTESTEDESNEPQNPPNEENNTDEEQNDDTDFLTSLLKSRGIEDKSKIKFENDEGLEEEVNWDTLSNKEKLNIIKSTEHNPSMDLDDSEIQLLNAIRGSQLTPAEYLDYISNASLQNYIQNNQQPNFEIDQYNDDELFLMDFMSRMGDVSEDEALEALEKAKSNEALYQKQVNAIRNEYKYAEQENLMQAQAEEEQAAQEQYNLFTNQVVNEINNLTEIQGFDLNMNDDDMQELYDFITGQDAAGNNHFAKALADPQILVRTAWLALNGDQMVNDIATYFQKEIANVRKESYKKGIEDGKKKADKQNIVYSPKSRQTVDSDLDDF